jgi:hypothetical protein
MRCGAKTFADVVGARRPVALALIDHCSVSEGNDMHKLIWLVAVVLTAIPLFSAAQSDAVTPKQIQEMWVGKTLIGKTAGGAPATVKLLADGTAQLTAGNMRDTGTWRLSDMGYCTTWKTIRAGEERCFTASNSGGRITVLNPDGSVSGYFDDIK